jgi:hypothetical protein
MARAGEADESAGGSLIKIFLLLVAAHVHEWKHGNGGPWVCGTLGLHFSVDLLQSAPAVIPGKIASGFDAFE